jgi:hypothetical protein
MTIRHLWEKCFDNIGRAFKEREHSRKYTDYAHINYYDLNEFRLKLGIMTPFYYIKDSRGFDNSTEFFDLKGRSKPAFIIYSREKPQFRFITPMVFMKAEELAGDIGEGKIKVLILKMLQEQCSLETLSPYEIDAAVFGDKFFGRKTELDKILSNENTNFIIFGSRRMGKTSLLKHLEYIYNGKKFSQDLNRSNSGKAIFLSCLGVDSLNSFQELLISAIAPSDYWKDGFRKLLKRKSREVYTQNYFKVLAKRYNRGIVLLLDEIDAMIESPYCDEIVKFQRMLSTVGYRFIQTGYRAVWREMQNYEGNFWNFSDPLHIAQFNKDDSLELITKPMENMGITLKDGVAQRIYQETGGIPNYIQHYCSVIISEAGSYNKKIDKSIFGMIDGSPNFDRIVMNSIHQNIRHPYEKLIVYFAAYESKRNFSIFQILNFCKGQKIDDLLYSDIRKSMDILIKMGFVQTVGEDLYRFIAPIIIKALRKRNIEKNLAEAVKAVKMVKSSKDD